MRALFCILLLMASAAPRAHAVAPPFDRNQGEWTALLQRHVRWNQAGTASAVDYAGFQRDRPALRRYLTSVAVVSVDEFAGWPTAERQAFLINVYNAATIELVLTRYPKLSSIKDIGSWFSSPWRQPFVQVLGEVRSLDEIEHGLLRGAPDYRDPRIHFALNCASVGCPALRPEAYTGRKLPGQLDDQTRRFLRDRSRNAFDPTTGELRLSKIFDWYASDFSSLSGGVPNFLAGYPTELGLSADAVARLRTGDVQVSYGDYDFSLNRSRP